MKNILEKMGVTSASELCAYTYNHGNLPSYGIYRKCDIVRIPCSQSEWKERGGRYKWNVTEGASFVEDTYTLSETTSFDGIHFDEAMAFAEQLDNVIEFAQNAPFGK